MESSNFARTLFSMLRKASKAERKEEFIEGSVNYSFDYNARVVRGNFTLPLLEIEDNETGEMKYEIADSLIPPSPPTV